MRKLANFLSKPIRECLRYRGLLFHLSEREVKSRYKGSYLGILWNIITPLIMLLIYTFVFGVVFRARWEYQISDSKLEFSLTLYAGIILYNLFSEVVNRASTTMQANVNYVKKVVFPLELLAISQLAGALVPAAFGMGVIVIARLLVLHSISWSVLLYPILLIPLLLLTLGLAWIISAVGVFLRDMQQTTMLVVMMLGYLTPVFYPLSQVPEFFQNFMRLNPLTFLVSSSRNLLIYDIMPNWGTYAVLLVVTYLFMLVGYSFFGRMKCHFADVL